MFAAKVYSLSKGLRNHKVEVRSGRVATEQHDTWVERLGFEDRASTAFRLNGVRVGFRV